MLEARELDLADMPAESLEFSADPQPWLDAARARHPWLARFSQGYMVHGYHAVEDLFADNADLVVGLGPIVEFYGMEGTIWGRFMHEMILVQDGEPHTRLRGSVVHAFTPRHANRMRPLMREIMARLLDEWAPRGSFDFAHFASMFPVSVMCGLLGVSSAPIPSMRSALESQVNSLAMDQTFKQPLLAGWEVMWSFADTLVKDREATGEFDGELLLDALIAAKNTGRIDETELRFMILVLVFAGYDTSKNMLCMTMRLLIERPEMYQRCARDKDYCGRVIQEAMRLYGIAAPYRVARQDFAYGGVQFRRGDIFALVTPFAGRDPGVFADPLTFDPDRANADRHVSLGRGPHICLGQFIARALLQEGLHLIAQRLANPRLDAPIQWRRFIGAWGPEAMPVSFDKGQGL